MDSLPSSVNLQKYINYIQPQENVPCCTASSTLLVAEMIMASSDNRTNFSRLFLYYMTRKIQGRLGQRGAELKATMEALSLYGVPLERYWPFIFAQVDREPLPHAMESAAQYKLLSYSSITPDEYKYYLSKDIPIIIGIRTGRKFWKLKGELHDQMYEPINNSDNLASKGHTVSIIGYDDELNSGSWIIANSVGPKWGHKGYAAIPYSCNVDIGEAYVITNFAGITAGKKIPRIDK